MKPVQMMPQALPKRPTQATNKYKARNAFVSTLDGVDVDVRTTATGGTFVAPDGHGEVDERLRNYGTVLARWSLEDKAMLAKRWDVSMSYVNAACRIVANTMYEQVFSDDASTDTVNVKALISSINAPETVLTPELLLRVQALYGTKAYGEVVSAVTNPIITDALDTMSTQCEWFLNYRLATLNGLHSSNSYSRRKARATYKELVMDLKRTADRSVTRARREQHEKERAKAQAMKQGTNQPPRNSLYSTGKNVREIFTGSEGWQRAFVHKPELVIPHTGKMGRRNIFTQEGKFPKHFYRMVTDPERRIFTRKTRALGGVVIVDCSGSMSLSEDDVRAIMRSSAGCTIVCYSASGSSDDALNGNIHLIARNGRQARYLPDFPGGNGVDGPALEFALTYKRSGSPIVWVSDEKVTGIGDAYSQELHRQCRKLVDKHDIHVVPNPRQAVRLLKRLQAGRRK